MSLRKIALINPPLLAQKSDLFTTGIVYVPVSLAHFAAACEQASLPIKVIDAFGEAPNQVTTRDRFLVRGLRIDQVLSRSEDCDVFVLYAINLTYHASLIEICKAVRTGKPLSKIIILENTQAVTAYSLRQVQGEFYSSGADFIITGEGEERGVELLRRLETGNQDLTKDLDGIGERTIEGWNYSVPSLKIDDLDRLPVPAWQHFPLENYWRLKYAHGPLTGRRYLPLLTSRGCPYRCKFCVIPETNDLKWRSRSAKHVVDEMEHFKKLFDVREFHIEDVDPTVSDKRTQEFAREILARGLDIDWKICAGTKVETIKSEETVRLMAESGCSYISISPESGSTELMKKMDKSFDRAHAVRMISAMSKVGIRTQACFVLGYPGETDQDRQMTREMVRELVDVGLDEIALFIITPVPGSKLFGDFTGYQDFSQLNFSPTWRADYAGLNKFRLRLYREFLWMKIRRWPGRVLRQCFNFSIRRFETKMEMTPYRAFHTLFLQLRAKF